MSDPVIKEIPIRINGPPLLMVQQPTVNRYSTISQTRLKPASGVLEMDIPTDTSRFYDESKASKWGGTNYQTLKGVLVDGNGYYVGRVSEGELHLSPVTKTCQLRPSFKYIDEMKARKQQREKELNKQLDDQVMSEDKKKAHVVQMTAKSTNENALRLGGALVSKKLEDEEDWVVYEYKRSVQ
ncbi:hypothetical protein KL938_005103 [Ogataea parapolymorpha]|nr:hypothetical protein KL938_005103 [Ogataea parapolymorpha]